jgi:hypothetical protein
VFLQQLSNAILARNSPVPSSFGNVVGACKPNALQLGQRNLEMTRRSPFYVVGAVTIGLARMMFVIGLVIYVAYRLL